MDCATIVTQMNWATILTQTGLGVGMLATAAWLARKFLDIQGEKTIEHYRQAGRQELESLKAQHGQELAHFKTRLEVVAMERQLVATQLVLRRAEAIEASYLAALALQEAAMVVANAKVEGNYHHGLAESLDRAKTTFFDAYMPKRMLFPPKIDELAVSLLEITNSLHRIGAVAPGSSPSELAEAAMRVSTLKKVTKDAGVLCEAMADEYRRLMGVSHTATHGGQTETPPDVST